MMDVSLSLEPEGFFKDFGLENTVGVCGVATVLYELFIIYCYSNIVDVFDTGSRNLKRQWKIPGLQCPGDIKAWPERQSLIIIDWMEKGKMKHLYVVDINGTVQEEWPLEDDFGRLDFTKHDTFVQVFHDQNALVEYDTHGEQIRRVSMPSKPPGWWYFKAKDIQGLQHAIKLDNGQFLLSHGDPQDDLHRVCLVDEKGKLLKSYGGKKGSGIGQLNVPVYLAVDDQGRVLVADKYNHRILQLNSKLEFQRVLVDEEHLTHPVKMSLIGADLYVADNKLNQPRNLMTDGRVVVFKYSSKPN